MHELQLKTEAHMGTWHLDEMDWSVDQGTGTIVFNHPDGLQASAPVQIVGSLNTQDGSWLWATANTSVRPELTAHARLAQAELARLGAHDLAEDRQALEESRAWEYAALATQVAGAQGAYRGPAGPTLIFMTFGQVTLSRGQA